MGAARWLLLLSAAILVAAGDPGAESQPSIGSVPPFPTPEPAWSFPCPANMLLNGGFEEGKSDPNDWGCFGLAGRGWEFAGRDGTRCLTVSGDGADAGWWYARRWVPVEHNRVYRVSFWARSAEADAAGTIFAGLNLSEESLALTAHWQQY